MDHSIKTVFPMMKRRTQFALLGFLSFGVVAYAIVVYGFLPLGATVHPEIRANYEMHRWGIYTHIVASAFALALGPIQFVAKWRRARPRLHRWLGRVYLGVGVLIGGISGLYMAMHAFGGLPARLGFGCLAIAWLFTGMRAYLSIRAGDVVAHRRWMFMNFSLTFAAVTLRLWIPALVAIGVPFDQAYPVVAWLCWIPNLLVARYCLRGEGGLMSLLHVDSVEHESRFAAQRDPAS